MTDIVVIGGGVAGISAAARLSHLGEVTLIEAEGKQATTALAGQRRCSRRITASRRPVR